MAHSHRIAEPGESEVVDRSAQLEFRFDGRRVIAFRGDTIASALAAAGQSAFSRSFKYHRPRGLLCCSGHCPNCLVQVGDEPNVRSCRRSAERGMVVTSQNVWPRLGFDLLALTQWLSRFLPVGFYYKTFMRPQFLWPLFERFLRRAAGLGKVDETSRPEPVDKQYLHADVAVIGGGPAGVSAAEAAAAAGCKVILFDENDTLGGHLRYSKDAAAGVKLRARIESLARNQRVELLLETAVTGLYADGWLAAVGRLESRLYKARATAVVVATGAHELPCLFDNNDLPGIMLGSAVQRLIYLYGVAPGRRATVVSANDDGWRVAADLQSVGVDVVAVAEERPASELGEEAVEFARQYQGELLYEHAIRAAEGRRQVNAVVLADVSGAPRIVPCDLIVLNTGWAPLLDLAYMAGGRGVYDEVRGEMRLDRAPQGVFVAGRSAGIHPASESVADGRRAGIAAASHSGFDTGVSAEISRDLGISPRTSRRLPTAAGGKRFVCLCEDVTDMDVDTAMAEGYEGIELLKRYSTVTMGPCQGKMCGIHSIRQCARNRQCEVSEVGKTTARPPTTPLTLGALAGQKMEPVQVSPMHEWHVARGARMMVAGLWLRPEHYGDPVSEVEAVRNRVGVIDVSPLGKFQLSGAGVPKLLDRMYVNKWHNLRRGRTRYGIMCDDEGVVLDDGVCARIGEQSWYMSTTSTGAGSIGQWLEWWMQSGWGEDVHLVDLTQTNAAINVAGPQSRDLLQRLTNRDLSNEKLPYMRVRSAGVAGVSCRILRLGFTGELSYEIHCPAGYGRYLWEQLMAVGADFGVAPFGIEAQRVLRLEKAHIIVGQDTDALSDAIGANAEWAISFDKPDFLGKRALQRISRRRPPHQLVGFRMADKAFVPDEGAQIVQADGRGRRSIIGWVTSSRMSPTMRCSIGLCWLPTTVASQEEASFYVHTDAGLREGHVHHGSFYDPEGLRVKG